VHVAHHLEDLVDDDGRQAHGGLIEQQQLRAGQQGAGPQLALKRALLQAYHGRAERVDHDAVLLACARQAGLDEARAARILTGDEFAAEVREAERQWQDAGIQSVPAVILNRRHLISGGQPPEVFEQALRQLAAGGLSD